MFKTLSERDIAMRSPTGIDDAIAQLEWENRQRLAAKRTADVEADEPPVEPLAEPAADDIPWSDLVFWLGSAATGRVDCTCATCRRSAPSADCELCASAAADSGYFLFIPGTFHSRLSFKIPVIQLPRIEGIN